MAFKVNHHEARVSGRCQELARDPCEGFNSSKFVRNLSLSQLSKGKANKSIQRLAWRTTRPYPASRLCSACHERHPPEVARTRGSARASARHATCVQLSGDLHIPGMVRTAVSHALITDRHAQTVAERHAMNSGADPFLAKPMRITRFGWRKRLNTSAALGHQQPKPMVMVTALFSSLSDPNFEPGQHEKYKAKAANGAPPHFAFDLEPLTRNRPSAAPYKPRQIETDRCAPQPPLESRLLWAKPMPAASLASQKAKTNMTPSLSKAV